MGVANIGIHIDVTKQLSQGANLLGVGLGKGTYDAEKALMGRYQKFTLATPRPLMLIAQLEYACSSGETGAVYSDNSWLSTVDGPHLEGSWYGGEEYDARKEILDWSKTSGDRSSWKTVTAATPPQGTLVSPRAPPLKVVETIKAVKVTQVRDSAP